VTDTERIVDHGAALTTWFVKRDAAWVKASEWPGGTTTARDAGPGTVWERSVLLSVSAGTLMMRVETRPRPEERRDPFAYLEREARRARRVTRRTYYRVAPGGRLTVEKAPSD
jgi:hypothetical protein